MNWFSELYLHRLPEWCSATLRPFLWSAWQYIVMLILWAVVSAIGIVLAVVPVYIYMRRNYIDEFKDAPRWVKALTWGLMVIVLIVTTTLSVAAIWLQFGWMLAVITIGGAVIAFMAYLRMSGL